MIVLFTDFGERGPYVGQMKAVLFRAAPTVPVVDLLHDAPTFDPLASAYLLAAFVDEFPAGTVFVGVIDPGVGSAARRPVMVAVDGRWFVGPDNGLFEVVAQRGRSVQWREIGWRPPRLSASFHGRDLFAPVAARLACGDRPPGELLSGRAPFSGSADLARIVYLDHFGNAMTGLRAGQLAMNTQLKVGNHRLLRARTFSDVAEGRGFWYENANGLAEIAVNRGSAERVLGLTLGQEVQIGGETP